MKTRVLSAVALLPLLLVIVLVLPAWATAALFGAAAAVAAYELLYRTGMVKNLRLVVYAMVMAVLVSFWSLRQDPNLAHLGGCWPTWRCCLERCCWPMAAFGLRRFASAWLRGSFCRTCSRPWSGFGLCMPARTLGKMIWGNITSWWPLSLPLPPIPGPILWAGPWGSISWPR